MQTLRKLPTIEPKIKIKGPITLVSIISLSFCEWLPTFFLSPCHPTEDSPNVVKTKLPDNITFLIHSRSGSRVLWPFSTKEFPGDYRLNHRPAYRDEKNFLPPDRDPLLLNPSTLC